MGWRCAHDADSADERGELRRRCARWVAGEVWGRNPDVFGGGRMRARCRCWIVETGEINVINYWILGCGTGHKLSHAGERCILARLARSDGLAIKYYILELAIYIYTIPVVYMAKIPSHISSI